MVSIKMEILKGQKMTKKVFNSDEEKYKRSLPFAVPDKEVQWHMARVVNAPATADTLIIFMVALSHMEVWKAMCRAIPWLGRHCLSDKTRWHIWNYFAERVPYIQAGIMHNALMALDNEGFSVFHGSKCYREFNNNNHGIHLTVYDTNRFEISLLFAGRLANCGVEIPTAIKFFQAGDQWNITLFWNEDIDPEKDNITRMTYSWDEYEPCSACSSASYISRAAVVRPSEVKVYPHFCGTCGLNAHKRKGALPHGVVTADMLEVMFTPWELTLDRWMKIYRSFIDADDYDMPQSPWRSIKRSLPEDIDIASDAPAAKRT